MCNKFDVKTEQVTGRFLFFTWTFSLLIPALGSFSFWQLRNPPPEHLTRVLLSWQMLSIISGAANLKARIEAGMLLAPPFQKVLQNGTICERYHFCFTTCWHDILFADFFSACRLLTIFLMTALMCDIITFNYCKIIKKKKYKENVWHNANSALQHPEGALKRQPYTIYQKNWNK